MNYAATCVVNKFDQQKQSNKYIVLLVSYVKDMVCTCILWFKLINGHAKKKYWIDFLLLNNIFPK